MGAHINRGSFTCIYLIIIHLSVFVLASYRAVSYRYKPDFRGYPQNFGRFHIYVGSIKTGFCKSNRLKM